ncbi:aromatic ring-hydroxylating dioxygenase subunit alpha [Kordiimonas sp. SCSIO 12610]|uniref:aromatic ring-hydroxylating oxygenase subunit alpha n=1 Tax=Kordiimonas sp. SCSIO 12610 TaxID=2829597 RepID=UPI00210B85A9|nr:SRPBCC family protein [Kordiimonas sp. SCSIO 12610]UTW54492.1 Rieske 2Fe-2S domain-containing protein [Kordiimonas sp. SCSIO 12610]
MDRQTEIRIIEELHGLAEVKSFFLDDTVHTYPVDIYFDPQRFENENQRIFKRIPQIAAHSCELTEAGSFKTLNIAGLPALLTRDKDMQVHAFLNVCRHRGAKIESEDTGCKRAFSCPYHAWTWDNQGKLKGVPHQRQGFPDLDKSTKGLVRLPVLEDLGLIWVIADPDSTFDTKAYIAPLQDDFHWLKMSDHTVAHSETRTINCNWKILVEGGIEAYHFKVAHKNTIGPHFLDNLSSFEMLGHHMRSFLAKNSLKDINDHPQEAWNIREHGNVLYSLFATDQFLIMDDHIAWISSNPISADKTELKLTTLVPASENTPEKQDHWLRNHKITVDTLMEDFELGEMIQSGLKTGANKTLTFGRFEGALTRFNEEVDYWLNS